MKINEITTPAIRNHYLKQGFSEEQIDEILPALAGVAARGAAALGGAAARGIAKGVAGAAKGLARGAVGAAKGVARGVATGAAKGAIAGAMMGADDDEEMSPEEKRKARELERNIRPGGTLKLPTQNNTNKPADFKVRRTVGQDVEIENPRPKPGEPKSFVFNKDELKNQLKDMR
jgi:hypothetical protein